MGAAVAGAEAVAPDAAAAALAASAAATATPVVVPPVVPIVPAVAAVPEKYEFALPTGVAADAPIVERTTATARELGLSNEAAQKLLTRDVTTAQEIDTANRTRYEAQVAAWSEGGAEFTKREQGWTAEALSDPDLGAGDPAKLTLAIEKGQQALAKYAPELIPILKSTGYGAHPATLKAFARIGRAMGEAGFVNGGPAGGAGKNPAQQMYPSMFNEDGTPKA